MNTTVLHVCCRVGDPYWLPSPGSVKMPCTQCGHLCMVNSAELQAHTGHPVWCLNCWAQRNNPDDELVWLNTCKRVEPTGN